VRVHNVSLATTTKASEVFRYADVEAAFAALFKNAVADACHDDAGVALLGFGRSNGAPGKQKWIAARDKLVDKAIGVLMEYRFSCAPRSPPGQLILPESVKLLPLLCLGALKGILLRDDACNTPQRQQRSSKPTKAQQPGRPQQPPPPPSSGTTQLPTTTSEQQSSSEDRETATQHFAYWSQRAALLANCLAQPVEELIRLAYPRLYELPASSDDDVFVSAVPTATDHVNADRAYLLDSGAHLQLFVGADVDPARRDELAAIFFDGDRPDWLLRLEHRAPHDTTAEADRLRRHVADTSAFRSLVPSLTLVDGNGPGRALDDFLTTLVEDKSAFGTSYVDFLCSIHREINSRMQHRNF